MIEELKSLMEAYRKELGHVPEILGLALSARKNLCIHPEVSGLAEHIHDVYLTFDLQVSKEEGGRELDNKCRKLTASFQRQKHLKDNRVPVCSFFEVRTRRLASGG